MIGSSDQIVPERPTRRRISGAANPTRTRGETNAGTAYGESHLLATAVPNLIAYDPVLVIRNYRKVIDQSLESCQPGALVVASGVAFLLSELADFAVYTPLVERDQMSGDALAVPGAERANRNPGATRARRGRRRGVVARGRSRRRLPSGCLEGGEVRHQSHE